METPHRLIASYSVESRPMGDGERQVLVVTVTNANGEFEREHETQPKYTLHDQKEQQAASS